MEGKNRHQAISKILMKAWRERWTEYQFGIQIKQALPSIRLPADAYNLTDVILEQTLIGAGVNKLLLSYLKHSLYSHLISYPAVITRITKYSNFERYYCVKALLDFLISIIDGATCRSKAEESALMSALLSLVNWLIELTENLLVKIMDSSNIASKGEQSSVLNVKLNLIRFHSSRTRTMSREDNNTGPSDCAKSVFDGRSVFIEVGGSRHLREVRDGIQEDS